MHIMSHGKIFAKKEHTYPVRRPAEDVNGDDGEYESRDFPMRTLLILGFVFRSDRLKLLDD